MSFCDHCQGQRFDRARILRALREARKQLRQQNDTDCSTDLALRGMPVFRGLIGPMPEGKGVVRYETPEVFETLTKEWTSASVTRSRRRRTPPPAASN